MDLQGELQRLSGTTLDAQGAANAWAGTTGLGILGALNSKAGLARGNWLGLDAVLNNLAGTSGLASGGAARSISGVVAELYNAAVAISWSGNAILVRGSYNPYSSVPNPTAQLTSSTGAIYNLTYNGPNGTYEHLFGKSGIIASEVAGTWKVVTTFGGGPATYNGSGYLASASYPAAPAQPAAP